MAVRFRSPAFKFMSYCRRSCGAVALLLIWAVGGLSGCAGVSTYTGPRAPVSGQQAPGIRHKVEPKQTLWRISRIYNVEIEDILKANNIPEEATIEIGQVLVIPVSRQKAFKESPAAYGDEFIWPLKGRVISGYGGSYRNLINRGIDIQVPEESGIVASGSGKVVFYSSSLGNFGKTIIIEHANGLKSVYSRVSEFFVRPGDTVQRGSAIGRVSPVHKGKSNYFHFEIRKGRIPQNPLFYLP